MNLSVVVATTGRSSLETALESIKTQRYPQDELIVVSANPDVRARVVRAYDARFILLDRPGEDWGDTERSVGQQVARGQYVAFLDDDDTHTAGAREAIEQAAAANPDRPLLFKLKFGNGTVLWDSKEIRLGNVGTPLLVAPNDRKKLGRWGCRGKERGGDFDYVSSMGWPVDDIVWVPYIIAEINQDTSR